MDFLRKKTPQILFRLFSKMLLYCVSTQSKRFLQFLSKLQRHFWKIFFCKEQGEEGSVNCSDWHVSLKTFFSLSFVLFLAFSFFSFFIFCNGAKEGEMSTEVIGRVCWEFFSCFFLSFSCFSSLFHRFFLLFLSIFCKFQRGEGRGKCQLQWLARFVENLQNRD